VASWEIDIQEDLSANKLENQFAKGLSQDKLEKSRKIILAW